jgi:hypothetical protein
MSTTTATDSLRLTGGLTEPAADSLSGDGAALPVPVALPALPPLPAPRPFFPNVGPDPLPGDWILTADGTPGLVVGVKGQRPGSTVRVMMSPTSYPWDRAGTVTSGGVGRDVAVGRLRDSGGFVVRSFYAGAPGPHGDRTEARLLRVWYFE